MAAQSGSQLLNGQLAALDAPLSDDSLHALALVVGPAMLLEALDLIDKDQGTALLALLSRELLSRNAETVLQSRPHHAAQRSTAVPSRTLFGQSTLHRIPTCPRRDWVLPLPSVLVRRPRKGEPGHGKIHLLFPIVSSSPLTSSFVGEAVQTPTRMSHRGPDQRLGEQTRRPRVARRLGHQIRLRRPAPARNSSSSGTYRTRLRQNVVNK